MIVPDVNLLLYASFAGNAQFVAARAWLEGVLGGDRVVGFAPVVVVGYVRLATSPRVMQIPVTPADAMARVEEWLARPRARLLATGAENLAIAFRLLRDAGTAGSLTTDAQIAAHAIEWNAEVHTADADFARFTGLRWRNPLR